jgi:hypothetical protein
VALVQKRQIGGVWITPMGMMNLNPATFFTSNLLTRRPNPSNFTSDRYTSLIARPLTRLTTSSSKGIVHDLTQLMLDDALFAYEDVWPDR